MQVHSGLKCLKTSQGHGQVRLTDASHIIIIQVQKHFEKMKRM